MSYKFCPHAAKCETAEECHLMGILGADIRRPLILLKSLLPFGEFWYLGEFAGAQWQAEPQMAFKPKGLMIWDAPERSAVELILIGCIPQIVCTVGPIPAKWFSSFDSYEQVWEAHERGKEPPGWGDFQIISVGMTCQVRMIPPKDLKVSESDWSKVQLLMWGEAIR